LESPKLHIHPCCPFYIGTAEPHQNASYLVPGKKRRFDDPTLFFCASPQPLRGARRGTNFYRLIHSVIVGQLKLPV
jgi:hypothetical protein